MRVRNFLDIGLDELSKREWRKLYRTLEFTNSDGAEVTCWRNLVSKDAVRFPRGVWNLLPDHIEYDDKRVCPPMPELDFKVALDSEHNGKKFTGQREALKSMLEEEQGLVVRSPGTGKTQIALAFVAKAKTRTLVLVHTEDILRQWQEYARKAIPEATIGIVRGREESIGHLTIATVQTLSRRNYDQAWYAQFGAVILDEAHHAAARTFEVVLNQCPARYRFGLSATPTRSDGMQPLMQYTIGPIIHRQKFRAPESLDVKVVPIRTNFYYGYRGSWDWSTLLDHLEVDEDRNKRIARAVDAEVRKGNSCLVLSRRITHLRLIAEAMETFDEYGRFLVGAVEDREGVRTRLSPEQRDDTVRRFRSGEIRVVLATQLADEALDIPILSRIFLTFPGKHAGRLIQQVGRALREFPNKDNAVIYDVIDPQVRPLSRQWSERRRFYRMSKIPIKMRRKKLLKAVA
jgi:superfamily II DNA or RNA helicase